MVTVVLESTGEVLTFPRINTVLQLLNKLQLKSTDVLVIMGEQLLTQDRKIGHEASLRIRHVVSRG